MTPRRLIAAQAVILVIALCQLMAIIFDTEVWPFSPYPMYSTVRTEYRLEKPVLYAVLDDGAGTEVPVRSLAYFAADRARSVLPGAYEREADTPQLRAGLADLLARYDAERAGSPPVRALRLYQVSWQLIAGVPDEQLPQQRSLIVEVAGGGRHGN